MQKQSKNWPGVQYPLKANPAIDRFYFSDENDTYNKSNLRNYVFLQFQESLKTARGAL